MKHFMVEIVYTAPLEQVEQALSAHRAYLQGGYAQGILLMSGPQEPRTGGIVIARGSTKEDVVAFFKQDPYALEGVATHRVIEFIPKNFQPFLAAWIEG
jgi:uncharacterized protein YciI